MSGSAALLEPDVLIVGAGPAGMAAAIRAHEQGAAVTVIDDNPGAGGQIWRGGDAYHLGSQARHWLSQFRNSGVAVLSNCRVISGEPAPPALLLETAESALECKFGRLILATGAREIFLPFPGWTLPGIMGAGGLQALAKTGLPVAGKAVVVAGSGPLLLAVGAYLHKHGARVKLIAEQASRSALARFAFGLVREPGKMAQAAGLQFSLVGVPYLQECWVERAEGEGRLQRVRVRKGSKRWIEDCDYAAIAYGLYPNTELAALLGCRMNQESVAVDELQRTSVENVFCAGEPTGIGGVDLALVEGEIAGYAAVGQLDRARALFAKRARARRFANNLNRAFALRQELKGLPEPGTLVCRCEDVAFERLRNFASFRAAKLQTRCGMGPCQGRVCGPAADFLFGWRGESIRPPIFPARVGSLVFEKSEHEEISVQ